MKGKILDITYKGGSFIARLDAKVKEFVSPHELDRWLLEVLDKAKDKAKKDLLKEDLKNWFTNINSC